MSNQVPFEPAFHGTRHRTSPAAGVTPSPSAYQLSNVPNDALVTALEGAVRMLAVTHPLSHERAVMDRAVTEYHAEILSRMVPRGR